MVRKLKGKVKAKGLRAALLNQKAQESRNKLIRKRQQNAVNTKKQDSKKVIQRKEAQKAKEAEFIPIDKEQTLLLVGEGDFSFARSIVEQGYIEPENLIATSYDASTTELKLKYPNSFEENYKYLIAAGVKVFFHIDATNLIRTFKLSKHTPWKKVLGPQWAHKYLQNIMFNFPHTGKGIKDQDRNIRDHQELVFGYFDSCKQLFQLVNSTSKKAKSKYAQGYELEGESEKDGITEEGFGKILLSVFAGEPYDSWQIKALSKENQLQLDRSCKFQWNKYPEYHHRRTNNEQDTTKPAPERDARTYIFKKYAKKRNIHKKENDEDED